MSWIAEHVTENPIVLEFRRYVRKFFAPSSSNTVNLVTVILAWVFYGSIFMMAAKNASDVHPSVVFVVELVLMCIVVPAMTHGSIAGEREKRTWDLLLVAPITKAQIVVGKFIAALAVVLFVVALGVPFLGLSFINKDWLGSATGGFGWMLIFQLVVFGYGATLAGVGLGISASTHRSLVAHGLVYVIQIAWLVLVPFVISILGSNDERPIVIVHPFISVTDNRSDISRFPILIIYVVLIVGFLLLAHSRVRSTEEA